MMLSRNRRRRRTTEQKSKPDASLRGVRNESDEEEARKAGEKGGETKAIPLFFMN